MTKYDDKSKILKYLFFISLIHLCILSDQKDKANNYFCLGKMFVSDDDISINDINKICQRIQDENKIMILIREEIDIKGSLSSSDYYYTKDSEEFFLKQCEKIDKNICDQGYMISIYTEAKKIRITAGKISKNVINTEQRKKIIDSGKKYLSDKKYANGVITMIDLIQSFSPYIGPSNNNTNITNNENKSSGSFWIILIFVICPCLCCFFFIYRHYQTVGENDTHNHIANEVHQHLNQLEILLTQVRSFSPPIMTIDICLICMNKIILGNNCNSNNPYSTTRSDMQNNLIIKDDLNTKYSCGHVYHNSCLSENKLSSCIMCPGNMHSSIVVPNNSCFHVIDENNVQNFIRNLNLIYDRYELEEYAKSYPNEYSNYNSTMVIGLASVWGVAAIAGTAYMMQDISQPVMYESYHRNEYNQPQEYGNNYGSGVNLLDTAEGDYE